MFLSSPVDRDTIHRNQTAMLRWLERLGHRVDHARDPDDGRGPSRAPFGMVRILPLVSNKKGGFKVNELYAAIGKPCPYCDEPMTDAGFTQATRDHKHPRSRGGMLVETNKVICCFRCNNDKDRMTLDEWFELLKRRGDPRSDRVGWIMLQETKGLAQDVSR